MGGTGNIIQSSFIRNTSMPSEGSALYRFNDQTIRSHFSIDSRASRNNEGLEQDGSCPDMQFWD